MTSRLMHRNQISRLFMTFQSTLANPSNLQASVNVACPFMPDEIRVVNVFGNVTQGVDTDIGSAVLNSTIFGPKGSFCEFISFGAAEDTIRRDNFHTTYIYDDRSRQTINGSFAFFITDLSGVILAPSANLTFELSVVLEFVQYENSPRF